MKLKPRELSLIRYSLRMMISQFSGKEEWNPEDWPKEQKEQRDIRRLLAKLENDYRQGGGQ